MDTCMRCGVVVAFLVVVLVLGEVGVAGRTHACVAGVVVSLLVVVGAVILTVVVGEVVSVVQGIVVYVVLFAFCP